MIKKLIVIINGKGTSGKDTICEIVSKEYSTINISSIDPIKIMIGSTIMRDVSDIQIMKSDKYRKLLHDVKNALIEYDDTPLKYCVKYYYKFLKHDSIEIMFVHIRESKEIQKFIDYLNVRNSNYMTLLVKSDRTKDKFYGNEADDDVDDFDYDMVYHNDLPIDKLKDDFMRKFNDFIKEKF